MSSRSIHRWLVVIATFVLWVGTAHAGRKRVVVLDFDGPKAEKFHEDVVKLLKKNHTVVSTEKWNAAAEEMDAGKVTEKNVKKLAKKLKLDGVITGKVDKRRDEYIIKLKLRSGTTGEILGNTIQTKADGPRIDGQAARDIKEELVAQIDELESNRSGGGDDEEGGDSKGEDADGKGKKSGFGRKDDDEDKKKKEDEEKKAKKDKEDEEKRKKKEEEALATKGDGDGDGDGDGEKKKKKKKKKKVAEEEEEGGEVSEEPSEEEDSGDAAARLSPSQRAIDAVVGLSFTRRNLAFQFAADLGKQPPGYRQPIPVTGGIVDLTIYPLAFSHKKKKDILQGIGLNVLYDQVLVINSRKRYLDGMGTAQTADLTTKENRWLVGGVFRYPLTQGVKGIVVGGGLSYGKQTFSIAQALPNMEPTDIPNVAYSMVTPSAFVNFPVTEKIILNLDAGFHAILNTGDIQSRTQYGAATVAGFSVDFGGDYMITKAIFARASVRYQSISFSFKGDPMSQTHTRDTDPEQDVTGAKDVYFGGAVTVGYVY